MEYKNVTETIILEQKSVRRVVKAHEVQLVNYPVATGKPNQNESEVKNAKRKVQN